jgi:hypothetical protein
MLFYFTWRCRALPRSFTVHAGAAAKAAADAPGEEAALAFELDLVEMLGHKGESYSQAIVELGFQLMAMRLTAEQAVNATRAFVQLQPPDKAEGDDYRIPSSARFREWRCFLGPICHYLSLSVIKLATKTHALHDATTKLGISKFKFQNEITFIVISAGSMYMSLNWGFTNTQNIQSSWHLRLKPQRRVWKKVVF